MATDFWMPVPMYSPARIMGPEMVGTGLVEAFVVSEWRSVHRVRIRVVKSRMAVVRLEQKITKPRLSDWGVRSVRFLDW